MRIHRVRQPFLCRQGQFSRGKRELCVGLDYNTLKKTDIFWCYLGDNRKVHYEIDTTKALQIGQPWKNKRGKTVIIIPVTHFRTVKSDWNEKEYEMKEIIRNKINSQLNLI